MIRSAAAALLILALGACGGDVGVTAPTDTAKNAVDIKIFLFRPGSLSIGVGGSVTWTQQDNTIHTVTAGTPAAPTPDRFDSGDLGQAQTFTRTFDEAGTFRYFCKKHTSMVAEIVVS